VLGHVFILYDAFITLTSVAQVRIIARSSATFSYIPEQDSDSGADILNFFSFFSPL
jgi:hypothetical protein